MLSKLTIALLVAAVLASFGAWQLQSSSADALHNAVAIQSRDVPAGNAAPESPASYRRILGTLSDSIAIRRQIDGLLATVERSIGDLNQTQREGISITTGARNELATIASTLGGAVSATRSSSRRLSELDLRLARSADLGRRIARQLARLDRKLGPSAGRKP